MSDKVNLVDVKAFLDEKAEQYENPSFIENDPIQIPHRFTTKEDIEISAFLTSLISWGNRKAIIDGANRMLSLLDNSPYDFVKNHTEMDRKALQTFVYRTMNGEDFCFLIEALQNVYLKYGGLESIFKVEDSTKELNYKSAILRMRTRMCETPHLARSEKHLANPDRGSAAKRINMFLRWMVRSSERGVDFGLWSLSPSKLSCPLDVHTARTAERFGFIQKRKTATYAWKDVEALDAALRQMDASDPVRYDFALFGIGAYE